MRNLPPVASQQMPSSLVGVTHLFQKLLNPEAVCLFVSKQQVLRYDGDIIWSSWGLKNDTLLLGVDFMLSLYSKHHTDIPVIVM